MEKLHSEIKQQNTSLQKNILLQSENDASDAQYTNYEMNEIINLESTNYYLFIIFYIVAVITCGLVLTSSLNIYVRIILSIMILIYPFVIYTIEYGLYYLGSYFYSLITFQPFNSAYLATYKPKTYETIFNNRFYRVS